MSERTVFLFNITGWVLFYICALLFMYNAIQGRDLIYFLGSLAFLIACVVFTIPMFVNHKKYLQLREEHRKGIDPRKRAEM